MFLVFIFQYFFFLKKNGIKNIFTWKTFAVIQRMYHPLWITFSLRDSIQGFTIKFRRERIDFPIISIIKFQTFDFILTKKIRYKIKY